MAKNRRKVYDPFKRRDPRLPTGWREPPPAKITVATAEPTATEKPPATAGQPAPDAQKPGVR